MTVALLLGHNTYNKLLEVNRLSDKDTVCIDFFTLIVSAEVSYNFNARSKTLNNKAF